MKTKDKKELFAKDITELKTMLKQAKDSLSTLRLDKATNKLKNTRSIFLKRKEIAKIATIIRGKELENEKNV